MFDVVYIEDAVREHPRVERLLERFPRARPVRCERFGEVFNRRAQHFRLQKRRPALVLAAKHGRRVLETPSGYGIGHARNHYFSCMLNCIYDCRYCFLQGMYRSAHLVLFVNWEDFEDEIRAVATASSDTVCFFSGYDCDSLALEPVTGLASHFVASFDALPENVHLELRTKSVQLGALLERAPLARCVVAFSVLPGEVGAALEPGVPPASQRLAAARRAQAAGWPVGLRFDPILDCAEPERVYGEFFARAFDVVDPAALHSASLGAFRLPAEFHRRMESLYPEERLFAAGLEERGGMVSYERDRARRLLEICERELLRYVQDSKYFRCET